MMIITSSWRSPGGAGGG